MARRGVWGLLLVDVVVTGGAGFVGSHLINALVAAGREVASIDTRHSGDDGYRVDIRDRDAVCAVLERLQPKAVAHLAGIADARIAREVPADTVEIGVSGTVNLLEAARRAGCRRFLVISSVWVHDSIRACPGHGEAFEADAFDHVYTMTMAMKEIAASCWSRLYGMDCAVVRPAPIYGPGMWPGLVLANFVRAALAGEPLSINGTGAAARRFVHVTDLADAILRILDAPEATGAYDVAGPDLVSVRQLADLVCAEIPGTTITHLTDERRTGEFTGDNLPDSGRLGRELGWAPRVSIGDGVRQYVSWASACRG